MGRQNHDVKKVYEQALTQPEDACKSQTRELYPCRNRVPLPEKKTEDQTECGIRISIRGCHINSSQDSTHRIVKINRLAAQTKIAKGTKRAGVLLYCERHHQWGIEFNKNVLRSEAARTA